MGILILLYLTLIILRDSPISLNWTIWIKTHACMMIDKALKIEITTFDIFDNFCIAWICFASYLWGNVPKIPLGIGRIWAKPLIEWVGESSPFHQKEMSDSGELNQTPRVLYCWEIPSLYLFFGGEILSRACIYEGCWLLSRAWGGENHVQLLQVIASYCWLLKKWINYPQNWQKQPNHVFFVLNFHFQKFRKCANRGKRLLLPYIRKPFLR